MDNKENKSTERAWYLIQTSPTFENVAKRNIERRIESMNMADKIFNVLVPEVKEIVKNKKGEMEEVTTIPYSGYVFVEMLKDDEKAWFMVRNTPSVTGILGSSGGGTKGIPLEEEEIAPILKMCGFLQTKAVELKVGDRVRVIDGPFKENNGTIQFVDESKEIVKVLVEAFGGNATIELAFDQVKTI